jgi:deoxycytidylate deaminase
LAAVIATGNRVISYGVNRNKPPGTYPCSIHAEDAALRRGTGRHLYVCRVLADGTIAPSKPCPECMAIIRQRGIETVYYTEDGWRELAVESA